MLYFAYGSNMSVRRLRQRVPSAMPQGIAVLREHRLMFHKSGRDGSAKCDAALSETVDDQVIGVVYRLESGHKPRLDAAEGLGNGYAQKTVTVHRADGGISDAFTYCATHMDPLLRPFTWYLEHVLRGAREHALPRHYVATIEAVQAVTDPDTRRHLMELAIYR